MCNVLASGLWFVISSIVEPPYGPNFFKRKQKQYTLYKIHDPD